MFEVFEEKGKKIYMTTTSTETSNEASTVDSYQVTLEPSGRSFSVPADKTILAAAIDLGISLPYGCRDGACGSCKCQKNSGDVTQSTYSSKALTQEELEAGMILTCRSYPMSDVVLHAPQVTLEGEILIKKMPVRVKTLERLSSDVMRFVLQLPTSEEFAYRPGQYLDFLLPSGVRRSYSMATMEAKDQLVELHLRHMPGGVFTDRVFAAMQEREILRIEGPFGSFYLRKNSHKPIVFVVSGTGFAPVKAILEQLQELESPRPVLLYWGGKRPADLYLRSWVEEQLTKMTHWHFVPVLSDALPEDNWSGRTGYVHQAVADDFSDLSGFQVYACGNPAMVSAAHEAYTKECNLPSAQFFSDQFTSAADLAATTK